MKSVVPEPIRKAQERGIEFFHLEDGEWKLELRDEAGFIEVITGSAVCIFANNGFGDYLFLKKREDGEGFEEAVFEFFHEGPEIQSIAEDLETLLGLKERPPSADGYPQAIYETGKLVEPGDRVEIKVWAQFWKGWQAGTVLYVPGVSPRKPEHEHGGLKWVAIKFAKGEICPLIDPETGKLREVRFIGRG